MPNKEQVKKLAKNPKFISGVYNYCDRWCERCTFTKRCMNYAMGDDDDDETRDMNNKKFWNKIHENFQVAMELLAEAAAEHGIDLNKIEVDQNEIDDREIEKEITKQHPCYKGSEKYIKLGRKWIEGRKEVLQNKENELNQKLQLGAEKDQLDSEVDEIADAFEIIQWYLFFISAKIYRALMGRRDGEDDDFPKDSDGSAKIALISIDRSISAWGNIFKHFPEEEDSILSMLALLDKMRKDTEKEFPDARKFVRPGFDK
ncbi:MAG: hypothetical protein V1904_10255 [Bacteroidota bacterium]